MAAWQPACCETVNQILKKKREVIVVMGVSGCGKSTIGAALAQSLGSPFIEGDEFHSTDAIAKMSKNIPLTDRDRWSWLARISNELNANAQQNRPLVVACSALKRKYRDFLSSRSVAPITYVYLEISPEQVKKRLAARNNHFMPTSLIESQFAALEPPQSDETALVLDAMQRPEIILQAIC